MDSQEFFGRFAAFVSTLRAWEVDLGQGVDPGKTTPVQYRLLQILWFQGAAPLGTVGSCLGLSLPNTSREVKKLTCLGLVRKEADPTDRRVVRLHLTEAGEALVRAGLETMARAFFARTGAWTPDRMARVLTALADLESVLVDAPGRAD